MVFYTLLKCFFLCILFYREAPPLMRYKLYRIEAKVLLIALAIRGAAPSPSFLASGVFKGSFFSSDNVSLLRSTVLDMAIPPLIHQKLLSW